MTTWFTSDQHFNHAGILKYRAFKTLEEMEEDIIFKHNTRVSKKDVVYVLGDFCFGNPDKYLKRLNGEIYLIRGNHDNDKKWQKEKMLGDIYRFKYKKGMGIILSHYPMREWDGMKHGYWHLYGHTHGSMPKYKASTDVGVDTNDFFPYSLEEIEILFKDEQIPVSIYP